MAFCFNADEALRMAETIERNGARFYRSAADVAPDEQTKRVLRELAEMEDSHERTFALMRKGLSQEERSAVTFDPQGQTEQYLAAMADASVFSQRDEPASALAGRPMADILRTALGFERESILFYLGIRGLPCKAVSKEKIDRILEEEMRHVVLLRSRLDALG